MSALQAREGVKHETHCVVCVICLILFMCAPHMRVWGHTGGRVLSMISIVVFFPTDIQSLSSDRDFLKSMELVVKEFLLL